MVTLLPFGGGREGAKESDLDSCGAIQAAWVRGMKEFLVFEGCFFWGLSCLGIAGDGGVLILFWGVFLFFLAVLGL